MKNSSPGICGIGLLLAFCFAGCKKDAKEKEQEGSHVELKMAHYVGGTPLETNKPQYENEAGNTFSVTKLQYFLSNIYLESEDGKKELLMDHWYLDVSDAGSLSGKSVVKVPFGDYKAVHFIFGFQKGDNVTGMFPNPPENNMEWPDFMGGGYHYMKMEGKFETVDGESSAYATHLGPTDGKDFSFAVALPIALQADEVEEVLALGMDLAKWYNGPNIYDFNAIQGGIMGNDSVQGVLSENGQDVFSVDE